MDEELNRVLILLSVLFLVGHFLPETFDIDHKTAQAWGNLILYLSIIPLLLALVQLLQAVKLPSAIYIMGMLSYLAFLVTIIAIRILDMQENHGNGIPKPLPEW